MSLLLPHKMTNKPSLVAGGEERKVVEEGEMGRGTSPNQTRGAKRKGKERKRNAKYKERARGSATRHTRKRKQKR